MKNSSLMSLMLLFMAGIAYAAECNDQVISRPGLGAFEQFPELQRNEWMRKISENLSDSDLVSFVCGSSDIRAIFQHELETRKKCRQLLHYWTTAPIKMATERPASTPTSCAFSPDGNILVSGYRVSESDPNLQTLKVASIQNHPIIRGIGFQIGNVNAIAFSPDGNVLATGSDDGKINLCDWNKLKNTNCLSGQWVSFDNIIHDDIISLAFSPDNNILAVGFSRGMIILINMKTKEHKVLIGHHDLVNSLSFSPNGSLLVSGSWDDPIRLWDVATGQEKKHFDVSLFGVLSVAFAPDGENIAFSAYENTGILNTTTNQVTFFERFKLFQSFTLMLIGNSAKTVAWFPGRNVVAFGYADGTVKLWDVKTGQILKTINLAILPTPDALEDSVFILNFSPDGIALAACCRNGLKILKPNLFENVDLSGLPTSIAPDQKRRRIDLATT